MEIVKITGYYVVNGTRSQLIEIEQYFSNRESLEEYRQRLIAQTGHDINFRIEEYNENAISTIALTEHFGFTFHSHDYEKELPTDEYYSLRFDTYRLKLSGEAEIHFTESYKFEQSEGNWIKTNETIELVMGTSFQPINITTLGEIKVLIEILKK